MQTPDLSFLQSRIACVGTALFYCENKSLLPFQAYIITALKSDDLQHVWFFISRNGENPESCRESVFPAHLEFYRKGYPFSVKIDGLAAIVNDTARVRHFMQEVLGKSVPLKEEAVAGVLLVKVLIQRASYKELVTRKTYHPLLQMVSGLKHLSHHNRPQLQPSL